MKTNVYLSQGIYIPFNQQIIVIIYSSYPKTYYTYLSNPLHRPTLPKHHPHSPHHNLHIQPQTPLGNILLIQPHNLFKVRNITSPTHLPHSGYSGLYGQPYAVVQFILIPFIDSWRSRTDQAHIAFQHIPELRKLIQ